MTIRETITAFELLKLRCSYRVTMKFRGLNRYELLTLLQVEDYCRKQGREVVGKKQFIDFTSGNYRNRQRTWGYLEGLLNKGFLGSYEYVSKPGSACIGISDLGNSALDQLFIEFMALHRAQCKRFKHRGKSRKGMFIQVHRVAA